MSEVKEAWQKANWLSRDILLVLRQERKVYGYCKSGQVTQENYRDAVCHCRERIHAVKIN